jgi:hypothetical protein
LAENPKQQNKRIARIKETLSFKVAQVEIVDVNRDNVAEQGVDKIEADADAREKAGVQRSEHDRRLQQSEKPANVNTVCPPP